MKFKRFNKKWFDEPEYTKQGKIPYEDKGKKYNLWYGIAGDHRKPPLLVLHGGPGGSHSNLISLQALGFEREVVFYDQLGCGFSDKPNDKHLWNIDRYIDEVKCLVDGLNLGNYHLLGHSWGGMLAVAFASKYPKNILSLSLMSPILNMPLYVNGTRIKLRKNLSDGYDKIIDNFEMQGKGDADKYKKALIEHLKLHICKLFPNPPEPLTRLSHLSHKQVHDEMIGENCTSELNILGNLKGVDVSGLLKDINIPILFSCGDVECCPPEDVETYYKLASNAELHILKGCRHMTMLEEPVKFNNLVREFICKHEK
ncbi:proline iminopeptidase-family hydrolase [Candidatus Dojkabacteria bacterium]|nr:proline iminopeptidase-family hydrolase [Candidatus Dojkabacteria bacterium]